MENINNNINGNNGKVKTGKANCVKKYVKIDQNNKIKVKIPVDQSMTLYKWIDCQTEILSN